MKNKKPTKVTKRTTSNKIAKFKPLHRYSFLQMLIFAVVIAAISSVLIIKSFAATLPLNGSESVQFKNINTQRAANRLPSASLRNCMIRSARYWAQELAKRGSLSHSQVGNLITFFGCPNWRWAAENVGASYTTSQSVFDSFMRSPSHRSNILNLQTKYVGIGTARSADGRLFVVQHMAYW